MSNVNSSRVVGVAFAFGMALCAVEAHAGQYFLNFSGTPSVMGCTDHSYVIGTGISYSWNLPEPIPAVHLTITAGSATVTDTTFPLSGPSGTTNLPLLSTSYAAQTPPYPITYTITPLSPGASSSGFSFSCGGAAGSSFAITNGASFPNVIPTIGGGGLVLLFGLLGLLGLASLASGRQKG